MAPLSPHVGPSLIVVPIFIKQELALHIKLHATGRNKTKIPTLFFEVLVLLISFYVLHLFLIDMLWATQTQHLIRRAHIFIENWS